MIAGMRDKKVQSKEKRGVKRTGGREGRVIRLKNIPRYMALDF